MNDPVLTLLLQFGVPILVLLAIGEIVFVKDEIRYRGKTFVRKYKDEIDKIEKINRNEGKV